MSIITASGPLYFSLEEARRRRLRTAEAVFRARLVQATPGVLNVVNPKAEVVQPKHGSKSILAVRSLDSFEARSTAMLIVPSLRYTPWRWVNRCVPLRPCRNHGVYKLCGLLWIRCVHRYVSQAWPYSLLLLSRYGLRRSEFRNFQPAYRLGRFRVSVKG